MCGGRKEEKNEMFREKFGNPLSESRGDRARGLNVIVDKNKLAKAPAAKKVPNYRYQTRRVGGVIFQKSR